MMAFGVDVLDPAVSPRRIALLLARLPPWARTAGREWSTEADLLALLIDHVAALTWVTLKAHGAKNVPRPRPMPRPTSDRAGLSGRGGGGSARNPRAIAAPGKASTWADAAAMLAGIPGVKVSGTDG